MLFDNHGSEDGQEGGIGQGGEVGQGAGDGVGHHPEVGNNDSGEDGQMGFQGGNRHIFLSTSKLPDSSVDWSGSGNEVDGGVWFSW